MVNRQYRPEKVLDMEKREFFEQSDNQGCQGLLCFLFAMSFCTTENFEKRYYDHNSDFEELNPCSPFLSGFPVLR